jgi:hypothetical protein
MTLPIHAQPRARNALLLNLPADARALHQSETTNLDGEEVGKFIVPLSTVVTDLSTLMRRLEVGNMATLVDVVKDLEDASGSLARMIADARGELSPEGRGADSSALRG